MRKGHILSRWWCCTRLTVHRRAIQGEGVVLNWLLCAVKGSTCVLWHSHTHVRVIGSPWSWSFCPEDGCSFQKSSQQQRSSRSFTSALLPSHDPLLRPSSWRGVRPPSACPGGVVMWMASHPAASLCVLRWAGSGGNQSGMFRLPRAGRAPEPR